MKPFRLSTLLVAAVMLVGVPVPAEAAQGSFVYWSTDGHGHDGKRYQLDAPPTGSCEALVASDQTPPMPIYKVQNNTDTPAAVFETKDCTGHRLTVPVKATRTAGGHGPASFNSVKFHPGP
jgi:hypothetical protein